jgi:hypothetical protein
MSRKQQQARREEIKRILGFLNEGNHMTFRRMYSPTDLGKDINQVVDEMPSNQLQWALHQVTNSYHSIFRILKS